MLTKFQDMELGKKNVECILVQFKENRFTKNFETPTTKHTYKAPLI